MGYELLVFALRKILFGGKFFSFGCVSFDCIGMNRIYWVSCSSLSVCQYAFIVPN